MNNLYKGIQLSNTYQYGAIILAGLVVLSFVTSAGIWAGFMIIRHPLPYIECLKVAGIIECLGVFATFKPRLRRKHQEKI